MQEEEEPETAEESKLYEDEEDISDEMREEIKQLILLPFDEFRQRLSEKFTEATFDAGFEIVKGISIINFDLTSVEVEDFQNELRTKLAHLFTETQQVEDFINYTVDYIIAN